MDFLEPLPEGCPPPDAEDVLAERVMYRLVRGDPPTSDDFRSQCAERPDAAFSVPECLCRGLSVFAERSDCEKARRLPRFRGSLVCRVRLNEGAGRIMQTFGPSHHTWWPLAAFDIVSRCQVVP